MELQVSGLHSGPQASSLHKKIFSDWMAAVRNAD
jgi:hypothetical protein